MVLVPFGPGVVICPRALYVSNHAIAATPLLPPARGWQRVRVCKAECAPATTQAGRRRNACVTIRNNSELIVSGLVTVMYTGNML